MPRALRKLALVSAVLLSCAGQAEAEDTKLGAEVLLDRVAGDVNEPNDTKVQINAAHTFNNNIVLFGSFETEITASDGVASFNLESTLGYSRTVGVVVLSGSAGVGERFQGTQATDDFPYYVLRVGLGIDLDKRWTWDAIGYRYRNAFNAANDYNTPEVSSGFSLKIDDAQSVYTKYYYTWSDGSPDSQGIKIGLTHSF
jgi:hypothetical protein